MLSVMSTVMTRILALVLAGVSFFNSLIGGKPVSPETDQYDDDTYFASYFVPETRFAVASDVHIGADNLPEGRLEKLFETAYAYSESQKEYRKLDAVFFAGDVANTGSIAYMQKFFGIVNAAKKPETQVYAVPGNHEFYGTSSTARDFMSVAEYNTLNRDVEINQLHFIMIYPDLNGNDYSESTLNWLRARLALDSVSNPEKPIFVFQHQHPAGTVYGSEDWGVSSITEVLKDFSQVVDFSGHSHFPIDDPHSIWQGSFTALGTGTLAYYEMGIQGYRTGGVFPTDRKGSYTDTFDMKYYDAAQYYLVEVDRNASIRIRGYDLLSDEIIVEYRLRSVTDPEKRTYTDERGEASDAPLFALTDGIAVEKCICNEAVLSVPQASGGNSQVQNYRFELYQGGEKLRTEYSLADNFYHPAPERIYHRFTGLEPQTSYTVKCYAVNVWGKESRPLVVTVTMKDGHEEITPIESAVPPDVFSLRLYEDGCAYDAVSKTELKVMGSKPAVETDGSEIAARLDGSGAYACENFPDAWQMIQSSMTMEFYGSVEKPENGYTDIFANMQLGGLGFEYTADERLQFWINIGGKYHTLETQVSAGKRFHAAASFDGSTVKLYVNGVLKASEQVEGKITFTADSSARFLCIGADSGAGTYEYPCSGELIAANVYGKALSGEQIAALYAGYIN